MYKKIGKRLYLDSLARCVITRNKKKIFLTPIEFFILNHFSNNLNKVLYIQDIVDHMNDRFEKNYTEQNIYVYIQRIRMKIEKNYKNPQLLINIRPGYILNYTEY